MSLITLKSLDDGQKAVEIPKGKTIIGRGPLLGCSDKKVSRNHAVLEVTNKDEVFLTPTHVNPCFYQPTADSPGQILKKDVPCKLHNGDSFSLLPRAYRYQLNIDNGPTTDQNDNNSEEQTSGKTNGSTVDHFHDGAPTNEEFGDTIVPEKAFCKEEVLSVEKNCTKEENTFSKRIAEMKESDGCQKNSEESPEKELTKKEDSPTVSAPAVEAASPVPPVDCQKEDEEGSDGEEEVQKNNVSDDNSADKVAKDVGDTKNDVEEEKAEVETHEEASSESQPPDMEPSKKDLEEEEEAVEAAVPPTETTTQDSSPVPSTKKQPAKRKQATTKRKTVTALESAPPAKGRRKKVPKPDDGEEGTSRKPGRTSSRTNRQTRQGLSLEDFIVSDDDEWQSDQSGPKRRRRKRGGKQRAGGGDSGSDWEVDRKKPKKASLTAHKGWSGSESGSEKNSQKKKKVSIGSRGRRKKVDAEDEFNENFSEEDEPQPSSSSEVKQTKSRTPCSFGKKCYRRIASHKEQFSHPGDSDYASEGEKEKKKNVDTISESDGESSPPKKECPYGANCFRKNPQHKKDFKHTKTVRPQREAAKQADQKNCRNSDDYDLNDSFLNDDSDEYKPVDSGSDYESGEQKTKKLAKVKGGSRKGGGKKL